MSNQQYAVAIIRNYYQGSVPTQAVSFDRPDDGRAEYTTYTLDEARERVAELDGEVYVTDNGEAGRPEYVIVEDGIADYISSGRNMDLSNYDWDDCSCKAGDEGQCCGECNECLQLQYDQDEQYIRDNQEATA
jgi:hypothetical protein